MFFFFFPFSFSFFSERSKRECVRGWRVCFSSGARGFLRQRWRGDGIVFTGPLLCLLAPRAWRGVCAGLKGGRFVGRKGGPGCAPRRPSPSPRQESAPPSFPLEKKYTPSPFPLSTHTKKKRVARPTLRGSEDKKRKEGGGDQRSKKRQVALFSLPSLCFFFNEHTSLLPHTPKTPPPMDVAALQEKAKQGAWGGAARWVERFLSAAPCKTAGQP